MQERRSYAALRDGLTEPGASRTRLAVIGMTAVVVAGFDQLTKTIAVHYLSSGPMHVIGSFEFRLALNTGAAFSLGRGLGPLIIVIAVGLLGFLIGMARAVPTVGAAVAVGMILGGATGNLVDRLLRGNGGAVIDFIYLRFWPTFNVADSCIVIGTLLLIVLTARHHRFEQRR